MSREGKFFSQVWTVAAKELRVLFRIPSVIIFTLCVPLLLYTPALIGIFVFDVYQEMNTKYAINVPTSDTAECKAFRRIVADSKRFETKKVIDGQDALKDSKIDLLCEDNEGAVQVYYLDQVERSTDALAYLTMRLNVEKTWSYIRTLKAHDENVAKYPFKVNFSDINQAGGSSQFSHILGSVVRVMIIVVAFLVLLEARVSTAYPAVTILASEREKQTILTTLSLPVSHTRLLAGKCVAALIVAFFPIIWNALALLLILVLLGSLSGPHQSSTVVDFLILLARLSPVLIPATLMDNWLAAMFYFSLCCFSRSMNETNMFMFFGTSFLVGVLVVPLLPFVKLNVWTALIPFVNLPLVVKSAIFSELEILPVAVAFLESMILIVISTKLVAVLLTDESFQSAERSPLFSFIQSKRKPTHD